MGSSEFCQNFSKRTLRCLGAVDEGRRDVRMKGGEHTLEFETAEGEAAKRAAVS